MSRDSASLRDDRLFIIACDDTYAPKDYFDFFRLARLKIHVIPAVAGQNSAKSVLDSLLEYDYDPERDERWLVLDTDRYAQRSSLPTFRSVLRRARQKAVGVALSKPCFELWLLLHHVDETEVKQFSSPRDVEAALRLALGEYNKGNLKRQHYPESLVVKAIERARRLDEGTSEIPADNTSRIYKIWDAINESSKPA